MSHQNKNLFDSDDEQDDDFDVIPEKNDSNAISASEPKEDLAASLLEEPKKKKISSKPKIDSDMVTKPDGLLQFYEMTKNLPFQHKKGSELHDLKILIDQYCQWQKEFYPYSVNINQFTKSVLDSTTTPDALQHLLHLRCHHVCSQNK